MKALTTWVHRPFKPYADIKEAFLPYICRLSVDECSFTFEWLDNGFDGEHFVSYSKVGEDQPVTTLPLNDSVITINGLEDKADYTFTVGRVGAEGSTTRLARTGHIPGDTVVNYLHPQDPVYSFSGTFIASPDIVKCPSGRLITAMDIFSGHETWAMLVILCYSDDGGVTWRYLGDMAPCYMPHLFIHRGKLYLMSMSQGAGNLTIGRSDDEGLTWTTPVTLFVTNYALSAEGVCGHTEEVNGRVYIPVTCGTWNSRIFRMGYVSFDVNGDLLDPETWDISQFIQYDPNWPNSPKNLGPGTGSPGAGIEGNMIVAPDGSLKCLYRMDIEASGEPNHGKMLILDVDTSDPDSPFIFNSIIDFTLGSNSKFFVDRDEQTGKYILIGTEQVPDVAPKRTVLSMAVSDDLYNWKIVKRIYDFRKMDPRKAGFQYPDWEFDGDDILLVTRVGFNGGDTHHNSNCITFERIKNFRQYF